MALHQLIRYSISNSLTLYSLALLCIADWPVLNESIQNCPHRKQGVLVTPPPQHSQEIIWEEGFPPTELRPSGHQLPVRFRETSYWLSVFQVQT